MDPSNHIGLAVSIANRCRRQLPPTLSLDDLVSSAIKTLFESAGGYNPKIAKESTYLYTCISRKVYQIINSENEHNQPLISTTEMIHVDSQDDVGMAIKYDFDIENDVTPESRYEFREKIRALSIEAQVVCEIIFSRPQEFLQFAPKLARGHLRRLLRKSGWDFPSIKNAIREIKGMFS